MSYFNQFQKIQYDIKGDGKYVTMTNLMIRTKLRDYLKTLLVNFDYYDVIPGETPESIAYYYYENVRLYWLVLLANNITDYFKDWPMSTAKFESYVKAKYNNINDVHHYELQGSFGKIDTIQIPNNIGYPNAIPITNFVYEENLQKERSKIRLIKPEFSEQFEREFEKIVKG